MNPGIPATRAESPRRIAGNPDGCGAIRKLEITHGAGFAGDHCVLKACARMMREYGEHIGSTPKMLRDIDGRNRAPEWPVQPWASRHFGAIHRDNKASFGINMQNRPVGTISRQFELPAKKQCLRAANLECAVVPNSAAGRRPRKRGHRWCVGRCHEATATRLGDPGSPEFPTATKPDRRHFINSSGHR